MFQKHAPKQPQTTHEFIVSGGLFMFLHSKIPKQIPCMYIHRALHSWCQFCRRDRLLGGGIRPGGAPLSNEHYKAAVTAAEGRLPKLRNICEAAVAAVADQADDGV